MALESNVGGNAHPCFVWNKAEHYSLLIVLKYLDSVAYKRFICNGRIISSILKYLIIYVIWFPNRTVIWDKNNITAQGFQDIAVAMEK